MSVFYITMSDVSRVDCTYSITQKVCGNLSAKWEEQTGNFI